MRVAASMTPQPSRWRILPCVSPQEIPQKKKKNATCVTTRNVCVPQLLVNEHRRGAPRHLVPLLHEHPEPGRLERGGEGHHARARAEALRSLGDGQQRVLREAGGVGEDKVGVGPVAGRVQERALLFTNNVGVHSSFFSLYCPYHRIYFCCGLSIHITHKCSSASRPPAGAAIAAASGERRGRG